MPPLREIWIVPLSPTPLPAGSYKVRVIDFNNCTFTSPANHIITQPATALGFSFVKTLYGAYNISCFGGNNGKITITASGGNGAAYSGYQYSWDGGSFNSSNVVDLITAGDRQISVKDGRGCVSTQTVNFSQAPQITTVTSVKDNLHQGRPIERLLRLYLPGLILCLRGFASL